MERVQRSNSPEQTAQIASDIAPCLSFGTVVTLNGDLGAGKTLFARGIARGLGVTELVSSPTFTIVQEYRLAGGKYLYHLDLYRIDNEDAALAFGVDEFLYDPDAITLVEWPERISGLLPDDTFDIAIKHITANSREISFPTPAKESYENKTSSP